MTTLTHHPDHEHHLSLEAALEFINTHELGSGHPVDRLAAPADAAAWFADHAVIHGSGAESWTPTDLARVRAVRAALREVIDGVVESRPPSPAAVELVNDALRAGPVPRLELDGRSVRVVHHHAASPVDDALAALVVPIIGELDGGHPDRFRTCASETCRWTFYDASPSGRRRWCDMKTCGNRAKAARHRERDRATPPAGG